MDFTRRDYFGRQNPAISCVGMMCPPSMRSSCLGEKYYDRGEVLGSGFKSVVARATHRATHTTVALKVYTKAHMEDAELRQVEREVEIHAGISHKNTVAVYAAWEDRHSIFIVLEHCSEGDLFGLKKKWGNRLDERTTVEQVLQPMLSVLSWLHEEGIIHRDIKPENILYSGKVLKLADFGLCISTRDERPVTRLGTLDYMAPEVLRCPRQGEADYDKSEALYNAKCDVWAIGILAYELLVGAAPFSDKSASKAVQRILGLQGSVSFPDHLSASAVDFVCTALDRNPETRPTMISLLNHPWINTYCRPSVTVYDRAKHSAKSVSQPPTVTFAADQIATKSRGHTALPCLKSMGSDVSSMSTASMATGSPSNSQGMAKSATSSGSAMAMSPRDRGRTTGEKSEPRTKSGLSNMFRFGSRDASISPVPSNGAVAPAQGYKSASGAYAAQGGSELDGNANEARAGGKTSPAPGLVSHRSTPMLATAAALSPSGSSFGTGNATIGESKWKFKKHLVLTQPSSSPAHSFTSDSSRSSKSHSASPLPMISSPANASAQRHQASYALESSGHDLPSPYLRKLASPGKVVLCKLASAQPDMLSTPKKTAA